MTKRFVVHLLIIFTQYDHRTLVNF